MNILAVDQARVGAWSVFDYEEKRLIASGEYDFPLKTYTFAKAIVGICDLVESLVNQYRVSAVFIEDINLRANVQSFKKLAQLQGGLISMFERNDYLYSFVIPSSWQSYCNARGRTSKEVKAKVLTSDIDGKKKSKQLSLEFVREVYGIETQNDNLADAICIGHYVVNNIEIVSERNLSNGEEGK
jgi:Holliday junction resolvasome RuvABC endonuclease subunit